MSNNRPQDVADILEAMTTPSPNEVYEATAAYDTNYIAAAAASKAHAAGGGSQPFLTAEIPLTNAQIITFGGGGGLGVSLEIVPAPVTLGEALIFQAGFVAIDASTAAYSGVDPTAVMEFEISGRSASLPMDSATLTALLGGDGEAACASFPQSVSISAGPALVVTYLDKSQIANLPLTLYVYNAMAGPFGGGDVANSGRVKVWYSVETLAAP